MITVKDMLLCMKGIRTLKVIHRREVLFEGSILLCFYSDYEDYVVVQASVNKGVLTLELDRRDNHGNVE